MKSDIFKLAKEFANMIDDKLDLNSLKLSLEKQNITLMFCGEPHESKKNNWYIQTILKLGNETVKELGIENKIKNQKSYACHNSSPEINLIFLKCPLTEAEQIHYILYELACAIIGQRLGNLRTNKQLKLAAEMLVHLTISYIFNKKLTNKTKKRNKGD